eukprot:GEMP01037937.1.p1 GENE.GEMP01037937.1~~GEMP01037937.1.p1  ORF type:complete len:269 (+),score=66.64 GEMP01037937.1:146-952(+)
MGATDLFFEQARQKEVEVHALSHDVEQLNARIKKLTRDTERHKRLEKELEVELATIKKAHKATTVHTHELLELKETASKLKAQRADVTEKLRLANEAHGEVSYDVSKVWKSQHELKKSLTEKQSENKDLQRKVNDFYHKQYLVETQVTRVQQRQSDLKNTIAQSINDMYEEANMRMVYAMNHPTRKQDLQRRLKEAEEANENVDDDCHELLVKEGEFEETIALRDRQIQKLEAKIIAVTAAQEKWDRDNEMYQGKYIDLVQNKDWIKS